MTRLIYNIIAFVLGICIKNCSGNFGGGGEPINTQPNKAKQPFRKVMDSLLVKDRVKRDDYDPDMTKIKFKIHAKYNWKAHAKMAHKMAAKWSQYY